MTLACTRESGKACVAFSGSRKQPRYVKVLPEGKKMGFLEMVPMMVGMSQRVGELKEDRGYKS